MEWAEFDLARRREGSFNIVDVPVTDRVFQMTPGLLVLLSRLRLHVLKFSILSSATFSLTTLSSQKHLLCQA